MKDVLESVGKPVWLVLMAVAFIWFWPVGVVILAYLVWRGDFFRFVKPRWWHARVSSFGGSGNAAFDEHREETFKQLDAEADAFEHFRDRLAKAKDKNEFDQFMRERR